MMGKAKQIRVNDMVVVYQGEYRNEHGHTAFQYVVNFSSFDCGVCFIYMPIDDAEEDGRIAADVDIRAGGDCVGVPDVVRCINAAWEAHEALNPVAGRFRMTNG